MTDNIGDAGAFGKQSNDGAQRDQPGVGSADAIQILPVVLAGPSDAVTGVQRLARAHIVPEALLAALGGPLGDAIATAATYAGNALSEATAPTDGTGSTSPIGAGSSPSIPRPCRSTRRWWRRISRAWPRRSAAAP